MTSFHGQGQGGPLRELISQRRRLVLFRLAAQDYALPIEVVSEIVPLSALSQPPGLPPVLAGFLNLGGTAVPVVRLALLLGLAESPLGLYTPLLILNSADAKLALLVDAVTGVASLEEHAVVPVSESHCFNDCAEGLATVGATRVVLLTPRRLFRAEEQRRMTELAAIEQSRLAELQETAT